MRKINKIVLHCTDSDDSLDIGFKEINQWHAERGWLSPSGISCGYHWIVKRNGKVQQGRPENEVGSHVKGHNSDSVGVVWAGRKTPSEAQYAGLMSLLKRLIMTHGLDVTDVYGHYELNSGKTCPNLDMNFIRAELLFIKEPI